MITWRNVRLDLRYLNNSVGFYALVYAVGFWIYLRDFANSGDQNLRAAVPILALSLCSFTHIASEKSDRVADRITVEHGGIRRRLLARMASLFIQNGVLLSAAMTLSAIAFAHHPPATWILTAAFVSAVLSTAGVMVAAALPHPILAMAVTVGIIAWGDGDPNANGFVGAIYGMLNADSGLRLADRFAGFLLFWLVLAALAAPFSLGYLSLSLPSFKDRAAPKQAKLPAWLNLRSNFLTKVCISLATNPIPGFATLFALVLYSFGTLSFAAKLANLNLGNDYFSIFPGLLLVNALPALFLASSSQRKDIHEQEGLLFKSSRQALLARTLQTATISAITPTAVLFVAAAVTNTSFTDSRMLKAIALSILLSPGMAAASIWISSRVRSQPLVAVYSYALTLPEVTIANFAPSLTPWLPSSMFSAICGGPGPYSLASHQTTPLWLAILFVLVLATWPFVVWFSESYKSISDFLSRLLD